MLTTFGTQFIVNNSDTTLPWLPMDTKERFDENINRINTRQELEELGYIDPSVVTYRLNKHGFRGPIVENCDLLALGCSNTMGIGVAEEKIWCSVVARKLNQTLTNLGSGGAGLDTVFRIADYWIPRLRPAHVLLLTPPAKRIEVFSSRNPRTFQIHHMSEFGNKDWWTNDTNFNLYNKRSLLAIKYICSQNNCDITVLSSDDDIAYLDKARDLTHPGVRSHAMLAHKFIKLIT